MAVTSIKPTFDASVYVNKAYNSEYIEPKFSITLYSCLCLCIQWKLGKIMKLQGWVLWIRVSTKPDLRCTVIPKSSLSWILQGPGLDQYIKISECNKDLSPVPDKCN